MYIFCTLCYLLTRLVLYPNLSLSLSLFFLGQQCDNCRRKQFTNTGEYRINFNTVMSNQLSSRMYHNRDIKIRTSENNAEEVTLCDECLKHLEKEVPSSQSTLEGDEPMDIDASGDASRVRTTNGEKEKLDRNHFQFTLFAFLWDMLNGERKSTLGTYRFVDIYGDYLWRMIPRSMRPWWIDAVQSINSNGCYPYEDCTLDYPPSFFDDKTDDFINFEKRCSESLPSMADELNNDRIMDQNILCPFGCSDSCRNCNPIEWPLIIQFGLKKVILNLPSKYSAQYRNYMYSSEHYFRPDDDYDVILCNKDWPVRPAVIKTKERGFVALACAHHSGLGDKFHLFPPRNPLEFNLNARNCDQIGPIQLIPRVARQSSTTQYGSQSRMNHQVYDYNGIDSFYLSQEGCSRRVTDLESLHYATCVAGRSDIRSHINNMARSNKMSPQFVTEIQKLSSKMYPNGIQDLSKFLQGSTYIPFHVAMDHHLSLQRENNVTFRKYKDNGETVDKLVKRAWPMQINPVQKEDSNGYGMQFRPISAFNCNQNNNTTTAWILFSLLSASSELWKIIDSETTFFEDSSWQGVTLTNVAAQCFQTYTVTVSSKSPFKKYKQLSKISSKINSACNIEDNRNDWVDQINGSYLGGIFALYNNIRVFDSMPDEEPSLNDNRGDSLVNVDILFFVTREEKVIDNFINVGEHRFEHRILLCLKDQGRNHGRNFESIRFMRHGGPFESYWMQGRSDPYTQQYRDGADIGRIMLSEDWSFVSMYVRVAEKSSVDSYRTEFIKSLGGQGKVFCECTNFPLISSYLPKDKKRVCNAWDGNGQYQSCNRKEALICSNPLCRVRCCSSCFKKLSNSADVVVLKTHDNEQDEDNQEGRGPDICRDDEDEDDDEDNVNDADVGNTSAVYTESDANDELITGLIHPSEVDANSDNDIGVILDHNNCPHLCAPEIYGDFESNDNDTNECIPTTNAGNLPNNIFQSDRGDLVTGHVLWNQCAQSLNRRKSKVSGKQREQHFIQKVCARDGGASACLMYPESMIFPRHLYAEASSDNITPLGALPLFAYRGDCTHLGLAPIDEQLRSRMTNQSTTMSTDSNYTSATYDVCMNNALGTSDSRILSHRGLRVNDKRTRLSPREEDNNDCIFDEQLKGCEDGHRQVRNLCASMKWEPWSHFYTLTVSHLTHPGITGRFLWKRKQEWFKLHPSFPHISFTDEEEFVKAFEDAYMHSTTLKWIDVSEIIVKTITEELTHIGAVMSIFSRHEYQESIGKFTYCTSSTP